MQDRPDAPHRQALMTAQAKQWKPANRLSFHHCVTRPAVPSIVPRTTLSWCSAPLSRIPELNCPRLIPRFPMPKCLIDPCSFPGLSCTISASAPRVVSRRSSGPLIGTVSTDQVFLSKLSSLSLLSRILQDHEGAP